MGPHCLNPFDAFVPDLATVQEGEFDISENVRVVVVPFVHFVGEEVVEEHPEEGFNVAVDGGEGWGGGEDEVGHEEFCAGAGAFCGGWGGLGGAVDGVVEVDEEAGGGGGVGEEEEVEGGDVSVEEAGGVDVGVGEETGVQGREEGVGVAVGAEGVAASFKD